MVTARSRARVSPCFGALWDCVGLQPACPGQPGDFGLGT